MKIRKNVPTRLCVIYYARNPFYDYQDPSKTYTLSTDASNEGIGAVLMQEYDGKLHPVSYASKKLSSAEKNYSTVEKECLAIAWNVKKFEVYLQSVPFVLQTDHMPLNCIASAKFKNPRIMRWAMYLQNFDMRLKPVKGSDNVGADYMSRSI